MEKLKKILEVAGQMPWHTFLIAIWFMFFPYVHNRNDLTPNVTITPIKVALLISAVTLLVWLAVYRSLRRVSIAATATAILIFGYGYIADFLHKPADKILLPALSLVLIYLCWRLWRLKEGSGKVRSLVLALNLAGLFLVLINLLPVALSPDKDVFSGSDDTNKSSASVLDPKKVDMSKAPDIYYIVPEDYAGNNTLASSFNYDNSSFTSFLRSRSFTVDSNALANYPYSPPSLSSTLNMRYLDPEARQYAGKTTSVVPYYSLFTDNQVVKNLKAIGYKYVHIGSWWGPTQKSPLADVLFSPPTKYIVFGRNYDPSEFDQNVMQASMGRVLIKHPLRLGDHTLFKSEASTLGNKGQTFFNQINFLKQSVKNIQSPKMVFMHIMAPHRPFVLDKNCNITPERYGNSVAYFKNSYEKDYITELQCVNKQLESMISYILDNSSRPPVIIMQSDEGEYPVEYWQGEIGKKSYDWHSAPINLLKYKVETQAAFYLPGVKDFNIKEGAFVNTFRYIFNEYLGADLPLLPQKYYISNERTSPYTFQEITKKVSN